MKILNLYAGIGGNRKLWGDEHEITAIENVPEIAKIYQDFFPKDKVIIADAHQYLLENFEDYDFIWSSPPCPSHSRARFWSSKGGRYKPVYPDMALWQEIIFLQNFFKGKWVVENVKSYYDPIITPQEIGRHYFWSNFLLSKIDVKSNYIFGGEDKKRVEQMIGLDISGQKINDKTKVLRNCVEPELGLHIFQEAFREYKTLFN
jgi:DNA (cytosine-5)-methyltransferase 1